MTNSIYQLNYDLSLNRVNNVNATGVQPGSLLPATSNSSGGTFQAGTDAAGVMSGQYVGNFVMQAGYMESSNFVTGVSGWTILSTGDVEFNNGVFRGTLVATTGNIGGWTINATSITDTAGATGMSSTVTGGDDIRFWAGNATPALAPFRVTEAGVLVASSATITGSITATTGSIGGWTIGATSFSDTAGVTGLSSAVTGGDDIRIWAGNVTPGSAPFRVTEAGALVASSATITGSITATSGAIGGFTINATSFTDTTATFGLSSAVTGGDDIRFWAGNVTPASAPFRVTESGVITATSGTIGGWTLGTTSLISGTLGNTVGLDSGGTNPAIYAGSATPLSAPFYVTKAGVLSATSGTIGGCVLATTSIGSTTFVSGPLGSGWNISNTGTAEFQNISVRGVIKTSVFEKGTISAVNGMVLVTSSDVLNADMTALDSSTITIAGNTTFSANEVIRIKDGIDDEWMLVTNAASAPTYTVTRDLAASYAPNTNPIWKKGTAVVSMGVGTGTKTGFVLIDSSSSNSPYIDIYARNSNTYSDYSLKSRLGWLKGITDSDVGLATTDTWGLYSSNVYLKGVIVANTGYIGGTTGWVIASGSITGSSGSHIKAGQTAYDNGSGFWMGYDTSAYKLSIGNSAGNKLIWDGSALTISGSITATTGTIGGWTITANLLSSTSGGNTTGVSSAGSGNVFYAGTTGAPTFYVTQAGVLTASGATISGSVTATTGTIGGFTLGATTLGATNLVLTSGAANTANISVGTGSNLAGINSANGGTDIAFWAGDTFANRATAPFRVTAAGNVTMTGASISGYAITTKGTFGGDGSDGDISGTLTITGSNNTIITKQYNNFAPGANTVTITPTGCILILKIKGNCDLTGTTFSFAGKGNLGQTMAAAAENGDSSLGSVKLGALGNGLGGTNDSAGGGGGGASVFSDGVIGNSGSGSAFNDTGGAGGNTTFSGGSYTYSIAGKTFVISTGAGGGSGGGAPLSVPPGIGGNGGGAVYMEVFGNLTFSGTTITCAGLNGGNGSIITPNQGNSGGGGGGGGGVFICLYNGTLTGSVTPTVTGGSGGTGTLHNDSSGAGTGGTGGVGGKGAYLIAKNTIFA